MKNELYKGKVNVRDELFARIVNSVAVIKQKTPRRSRESYTCCCQESWKVHCSRWWYFWTLTL